MGPNRESRSLRGAGLALAAALLVGCASTESFELGGSQADAWQRFHDCQRETNAATVKLTRIEPSGRLHYTGRRIDLNKMRECLATKRAAR
jgi:hypothetical protein